MHQKQEKLKYMADSIKKLTDLFAKFPTIGQRTAGRFVFYLINQPKEKIEELTNVIQELKNKIKLCNFCFNPHEGEFDLCYICQNPSRNRQLLCIVEKETDLLSIENTKRYNGLYFILGGALMLKKSDDNNLRIKELKERIVDSAKFTIPKIDFTEVIIAINPTPEGKATSVLVERALKDPSASSGQGMSQPDFKITHLAKGLPVGGESEYADEETLEAAFEGRKYSFKWYNTTGKKYARAYFLPVVLLFVFEKMVICNTPCLKRASRLTKKVSSPLYLT